MTAALCLLASVGVAASALAHPLHTSLMQVSVLDGGRRVSVSVRLFADDFSAAIGRPASGSGAPSDSAAFAYLRGAVTVAAGTAPLPLRARALRREGDLVWADLDAELPAGAAAALRVQSRVLFERYPDQVNIVRVVRGERAGTVLFTPGDGLKAAP